jgi:cob(I)alamin adenosyltransferase
LNTLGKVRVFTGEGKGKTTSAVGLAVLAVARGFKVLMIQFLKASDTTGEHIALRSLAPKIIIKPMGRKGFIFRRGCEPMDIAMAKHALDEARSTMGNGNYDIIVLDEVNVAVHLGLIKVQDVLNLINSKPDNVELVLTGRYAHPEIIDRADVVFQMKKIKHHFDRGVKAQKGIDY